MIYKSFADVKLPPLTIPKISREYFASLTKKQQDEYLWLYKTQVVPCLEVFRKPAPFKLTYGGRGCVDEDTFILTPEGNIKIKDFKGGLIYSFDGKGLKKVFACKPTKYEAENLYKISSASHSVTVTANHRFLTQRGWVKALDLKIGLDYFFFVSCSDSLVSRAPLDSSSGNVLLESLQDVQHCLRIILGWINRYWQDFRPCGEQPLLLSGIDLDVLPLQDDGSQHKNPILSREGDQELAYIYDLICQSLDHLQSLSVRLSEAENNFAYQESYICDKFFELFSVLHREFLQFHKNNSLADITHKFALLVQAFYNQLNQDGSFQKVSELQSFFFLDNSFSNSLSICNHDPHIIAQEVVNSIEFVEKKYFYDFYVPVYNNYISNGIISHNSGKSHSVASLLMQELTKEPHRLVCVREFQNSIAESSYRLLVDKINNLGLSGWDIKKDYLENENGSRVIFRGLKDMRASSAIKSLESYDRAFIEEGATISKDSLRMLIPTIRANGSEIYAVWNPETDNDPIMSLCNKTGAVVVECNWYQNPWFTERLFTEMSDDYRQDPDEAEHTWGGKPRNQSENSIHSRVSVREAMERQLVPEGAKVVAADIARMGSDETVISTRHGLVMTSIKGYKHKTLVETADLIEMAADYDKSRLIRVDETGLGAGVVDILRARGYRNIEGINFGSNADDPDRYGNLPSQMWFEINMDEVSLINNERLYNELTNRRYSYDNKCRRVIESKDAYKSRCGGKSCDYADSVIMLYHKPKPKPVAALY